MMLIMKINALREIKKRNDWEEEKKLGLSLLFGQPQCEDLNADWIEITTKDTKKT